MSTTHYVPPPDQTATQHEGASSLAINNTFFRRLMTLIALKTSARFYKHDGPCVPISKSGIVRKGPFAHLTEAATLEFVAANTSIPVPRVHCSFVHNNRAYIIMQRIQGKILADVWKDLSNTDRTNLFAQLRRMFQEHVASKTASGRYLNAHDMLLPKPTWDMLQGKEVIPKLRE
ncbi:serine threonine kinase [Fusarium beomiforme]|uniref:Serine threonine kinase n=1 Tax=Fusarium beomiforme TaxID=44412 RepID=A0A9P5DS61_9HYPO|nr:serine threonine kinase [Fusarium beomiforme]